VRRRGLGHVREEVQEALSRLGRGSQKGKT
jgi:hypothetical protein